MRKLIKKLLRFLRIDTAPPRPEYIWLANVNLKGRQVLRWGIVDARWNFHIRGPKEGDTVDIKLPYALVIDGMVIQDIVCEIIKIRVVPACGDIESYSEIIVEANL